MRPIHIRKTAAVTVEHGYYMVKPTLSETRRVLSKLAKHAPAGATVAIEAIDNATPYLSTPRPTATDIVVEWSEWA